MNGTGIVYWPPLKYVHFTDLDPADATAGSLQLKPVIIPGTGYQRNRSDRALETLASRIGVVTNHIVLEGYIVFTTDLNKLFSYRTTYPTVDFPQPEPVELTTFYSDSPSSFRIRDLQGSFRSFALFTTSGSVLTASCSLLDTFHLPPGATSSLPHPNAIVELQGQSIISIAFGDHHFHALHATGTITSYGTEPRGCGALGLGCKNAAKLRGVGSHRLKEGEGRTVWFDPMMHTWLQDMSIKGRLPEAAARSSMLDEGHDGACDAFADYFEHEGRKWEDGLVAEGELGGYFVLKVSAAGWHSAAMVLVDEEKVEMARQRHLVVPPAKSSSSSRPNTAAVPPYPYGLESLCMYLVHLVRWFLGLTARDAIAAEVRERGRRRREGVVHATGKDGGRRRGDADEVVSDASQAPRVPTWAEDPFPRLRMANGEVMPGEIAITERWTS